MENTIKQRRRVWGKSSCLALTGLVFGLSASAVSPLIATAQSAECQNGNVKALIVGDTSGRLGVLGPHQARGTQAAVDVINEEGGLLGCKIELAVHDDQLDPAISIRELKKAIATDRPNVVFGPTLSSSLLGMTKVTNAQKIPMFSGAASDAQFVMDDPQPGNYMAITTLYQDGRAAAQYLAETGKCKRYGLLYPDIVAGRDIVAAFRDQLNHVQPAAEFVVDQPYNLQNKDFGAIVQVIAGAAPDCVFGNLLGADLGTVYKVWKQKNLKILTMFYPDTASLKAIGNGNLPDNTHGVMRANVKTMAATPIGRKFTERYKAANNGEAPDEWAYAAASAVQMWGALVVAAGSFDFDQLDATAGKGGQTFDSVFGDDIEILPNHQANVWTSVGQIVDDSELGYPYWSDESKHVWMRDVISKELYESILAGKISTHAK